MYIQFNKIFTLKNYKQIYAISWFKVNTIIFFILFIYFFVK